MKTKIVVIDDDRGACLLLKKTIEKADRYQVVTTIDSQTAEELCCREKPEVIIVDNVMPDMKGSDLIKKLRINPLTKDIPIVMITGKGELTFSDEKGGFEWKPNVKAVKDRGELEEMKNPESIEEAYGVDVYLAKPAPSDKLLKYIDLLVMRKQEKDDLDDWKKYNT